MSGEQAALHRFFYFCFKFITHYKTNNCNIHRDKLSALVRILFYEGVRRSVGEY